jgi:hypothetical protein
MSWNKANSRVCRSANALRGALSEMAKLIPDMIDDMVRNLVEEMYLWLAGTGDPTTPIRTGRARTGWRVGTAPDEWCPPDMEHNRKSAGEVLAAARAAVKALPRSEVYYLWNNVPYLMRLERGHSRQAPKGFIAVAIAHLAVAVDERVKELNAV